MMDDKRLQEIKARAEAATQGEWTLKKYGRYEDHDECRIDLPDDDIELCRYENGEFIAHSRTDIPDLISEVERLGAYAKDALIDYGTAVTMLSECEQENTRLRAENESASRIGQSGAWCYDCGALYGTFPDYVLLDEKWAKIAPEADGYGILCPTCIAKRLDALGLWNEGEVTEIKRLRAELEAAKRDIRELLFDDGLTRCECCAHLDQCDPDYDCSEDAQEQPNHFFVGLARRVRRERRAK